MKIDLRDPRVEVAFNTLIEKHNEYDSLRFAKLFEDVYHCKVVADQKDIFCTTGWLEIPDERYQNWFVLQFGAHIE